MQRNLFKPKNIAVILGGMLLLSFLYIRYSPYKYNLPQKDRLDLVKTGDLVLAEGHSIKSDCVRLLGGKQTNYSHVGIVYRVQDSISVVHMNVDKNRITKQSITEFANCSNTDKLSFYRTITPINEDYLEQMLDSLLRVCIPFDKSYSLQSDDSYYCTELVYKTYNRIDKKVFKNLMFKIYIYPKDLISNSIAYLLF